MILSDLLPEEAARAPRLATTNVSGLTADSRKVERGFAFFAIPGSKADGLQFVPQAVAKGAAVIVAERAPSALADGVAFIRAANVRRALALAAARFFGRQPATIAAITGTSGKTSVAAFTRQIWQALGQAAASIGTIGVVSPRGESYGSLTTPDPVELHRTLAALAEEGVTHLAMEASSHGLDQFRLDGVRVRAGAFTNLSRDHLDYHPTLDAYLQAKLRLFSELVPPGGGAVIVADREPAERVVATAKARALEVFTVGRHGDGIRLVETKIDGFAQRLTLEQAGRRYAVRLPLVGTFQVENALVAAGLAIVTGSEAAAVFATLEGLRGAKGRLDLAGEKDGAPIFVDCAHKPDALAKTLEALRPFASHRLIVVFGAGGDRDPGKRALMGAAAAARADRVIVTDDNPRSEDPAAIRAAILSAAPGAIEIGDRATAIRQAIAELRRGDVLVIAGKGHESGQIVGERVLPFSDHDEVVAALEERTR
ncbi:MAG: UDP-N-acetylmuramoyl-L-alanyl-D-glutamate--2,6-diaminopimelate ligase [Pseudorhodoplanes sp.]|nr:MAG: UDP-N-acetylmuramoyl-L-alanyl-D-glutamate--2,6-diaminopimelate ligase [Pseudorhodoplanes sp.]